MFVMIGAVRAWLCTRKAKRTVEKEAFTEAAKKAGHDGLSAWLRWLARTSAGLS
jgi:hypothetical protein